MTPVGTRCAYIMLHILVPDQTEGLAFGGGGIGGGGHKGLKGLIRHLILIDAESRQSDHLLRQFICKIQGVTPGHGRCAQSFEVGQLLGRTAAQKNAGGNVTHAGLSLYTCVQGRR